MTALSVAGIIIGLILLDILACNISGSLKLNRLGKAGGGKSGRPVFRLLNGRAGASVARGMFHHRGQMWAHWLPNGNVRAGVNDLLHRLIGRLDEVKCPAEGEKVKQGEKVVMLRQGDRVMYLLSPVTGLVTKVNEAVAANPGLLKESPYEKGWIYEVSPSRAGEDLHGLVVSESAEEWTDREEERMRRFVEKRLRTEEWNAEGRGGPELTGILESLGEETWILFKDQFIYQQEWRA
jgi:glycine cleavage system H protein